MEDFMEEDLSEDHDWDGTTTSGGLLTVAEYKTMEETRKGLGYLEANYW